MSFTPYDMKACHFFIPIARYECLSFVLPTLEDRSWKQLTCNQKCTCSYCDCILRKNVTCGSQQALHTTIAILQLSSSRQGNEYDIYMQQPYREIVFIGIQTASSLMICSLNLNIALEKANFQKLPNDEFHSSKFESSVHIFIGLK